MAMESTLVLVHMACQELKWDLMAEFIGALEILVLMEKGTMARNTTIPTMGSLLDPIQMEAISKFLLEDYGIPTSLSLISIPT